MTQTLYLDSRDRSRGSTVSQAKFYLRKPLTNVHRMRLKSAQIVNSFPNINGSNNTLSTSSGAVVLPPKFYSGSEFVATLDNAMQSVCGPFVPAYVSFIASNNSIQWTIGALQIASDVVSTMSDVLGLTKGQVYTGSFTTQLYLALPQYVCFDSPAFREATHGVFAGDSENAVRDSLSPFLTIPLSVCYLQSQTYQASYERSLVLDTSAGGRTISQIDVSVRDPKTGLVLSDTTHWAMLIEFD